MGGLGWSLLPIAPGTDMVYKYECPITADGRILALLGHYHAHGKRFTAHIRRASGAREKVFEMYDYLDPRDVRVQHGHAEPDVLGHGRGRRLGHPRTSRTAT